MWVVVHKCSDTRFRFLKMSCMIKNADITNKLHTVVAHMNHRTVKKTVDPSTLHRLPQLVTRMD